MATLVVEDGSIVANANTYVTLEETNTYHEDRANDEWFAIADNDDRIKIIIRAFWGLENIFRSHWVGFPTNNNSAVPQVIAWPRKANQDSDDTDKLNVNYRDIGLNNIPLEVKMAQMESALIELTNPIVQKIITPDDYTKRDYIYHAVETEYQSDRPVRNTFPILDRTLSGFITASTDSTSVVVSYQNREEDDGYIKVSRLRQFGLFPYNG